jgi:hypothetical protein
MRRLPSILPFAFAALLTYTSLAAQTATAGPSPDLYGALHWRHIGPEGNRFSAAAGIPGDPHPGGRDGRAHWRSLARGDAAA